MTTPRIGALEAARRVLEWCVLHRAHCRVVEYVPAGAAKLAIGPRGALPVRLADHMRREDVRNVIGRHLDLGAARFCLTPPDAHTATAAAFAHLALCLLTPDQRELFEERAAMREYTGEMPRPTAELFALFDVVDQASTIEAVTTVAAHAAA